MGPLAWVALAGLNAALASSKASQQARQRKAEADIRAAEIEAAPWTGKAPTTQVSTATPNIWGELAGAGINTVGQGAALQQAGLFGEGTPEVPTSETPSVQESPYTLMYKQQNKSQMIPFGQNKSFLNPWETN